MALGLLSLNDSAAVIFDHIWHAPIEGVSVDRLVELTGLEHEWVRYVLWHLWANGKVMKRAGNRYSSVDPCPAEQALVRSLAVGHEGDAESLLK